MTIAQAFEITYQKVMQAHIVRNGRQDGGGDPNICDYIFVKHIATYS